MSTSGLMKTLAFHQATQGKAVRMSAFSVKQDASPARRQDAANEHQCRDENLGFSSRHPRKDGQDARAFRKASPTTNDRQED